MSNIEKYRSEPCEGTLTAEDKQWIWDDTKCRASVRFRDSWRHRKLTVSGRWVEDSAIMEARDMALECIARNWYRTDIPRGGGAPACSQDLWLDSQSSRLQQEDRERQEAQRFRDEGQVWWQPYDWQQHGGWMQHGGSDDGGWMQQHGGWTAGGSWQQQLPIEYGAAWSGSSSSNQQCGYGGSGSSSNRQQWHPQAEASPAVAEPEAAGLPLQRVPMPRDDAGAEPEAAGLPLQRVEMPGDAEVQPEAAEPDDEPEEGSVVWGSPSPWAMPGEEDEPDDDAEAGQAVPKAEAGPAEAGPEHEVPMADHEVPEAEAGPADAKRQRAGPREELQILTFGLKQDRYTGPGGRYEDDGSTAAERILNHPECARSFIGHTYILLDARDFQALTWRAGFHRGDHIGTNTRFMEAILHEEEGKVRDVFAQAVRGLRGARADVPLTVVVYCEHGKHRSVALANLLREACISFGRWVVPELKHVHIRNWKLHGCGREKKCWQCDNDAENKRPLFNAAARMFSELWAEAARRNPWEGLR